MARELPYAGPPEGGGVFRASRDFDVFAPPDWTWTQEDGTFGNRFDDPGRYRGILGEDRFRMVYCATQRAGAFGETIARFRRSPRLAEELRTIDDEESFEPELEGGVLPEEWRLKRRLGSTRLDESLVFADFASAETFQILTEDPSLSPSNTHRPSHVYPRRRERARSSASDLCAIVNIT